APRGAVRRDRRDPRSERGGGKDAVRPGARSAPRRARTGRGYAMTLRDPEVFETLRDEPELLALADAVAETQQLDRPRRRVPLVRPLALAAAGAAAVVAVLLWPGGGGHNPVLDRALAAIG